MDLLDRLEALRETWAGRGGVMWTAYEFADSLSYFIAYERRRREPVCICDPKHSATDTGCRACFRPDDESGSRIVHNRETVEAMTDAITSHNLTEFATVADALDDPRDALLSQAREALVLCESVDMGCLQDSDPCCHCAVCGRQDCTIHKDDCKLAAAIAAIDKYKEATHGKA